MVSQLTDKAQQQKEKKELNRVCKNPVPKTGDMCVDTRNNIERLKLCVKLREEYSKKWYNDGEPNHADQVADLNRSIAKQEKWLEENCNEKCN